MSTRPTDSIRPGNDQYPNYDFEVYWKTIGQPSTQWVKANGQLGIDYLKYLSGRSPGFNLDEFPTFSYKDDHAFYSMYDNWYWSKYGGTTGIRDRPSDYSNALVKYNPSTGLWRPRLPRRVRRVVKRQKYF